MAGTTTVLVASGADPDRVRIVAERHRGRVVADDRCAFTSAGDGVGAAVDLLRADESVAAGLSTGDDVDAADAVATRLCRAAGPGRILVAEVVRLLAGADAGIGAEPVTVEGVTAYPVTWAPDDAPPLRVVVAEDAALIRSGIVSLLDDNGFTVTVDVGDATALLAAVDADPPDLVITDIRMPPTNTDEGLRAAAEIRARHPAVAVLVLSQHIEARAAAALLDGRPAGIGYVLKERVSALDEFLAACRTVAAGGSVVDPLVAEQLLHRRRHDDALARLTDRERDVLALMAQGRSNAAIAESLFLGAKTVETHVGAIFRTLDLEETSEGNRRVQAVLEWLQP
jgi:DNA-binding NarL/FixJ family response regulator